MAFELVYTSAPRGIKPGSSGFCTVAYTNGLAANTAAQLEALSAYRAYFPHYDEHAKLNPIAHFHCRITSSGEELHVLSRICFNGLDYTRRSNKLAHHLVLRPHDIAQAPAGPAALFLRPGLFFSEWNREPQLFPRQKDVTATDAGNGPAACWESYTGDAGWAGTLVESYLQAPSRPAFIIYDPLRHHDVLTLLNEAARLLPETDRWELTFNTYFSTLPAGISCAWRFCVPNSEALRAARRSPDTLILDLTSEMPAAAAGDWQNYARSGIAPPALILSRATVPASAKQPGAAAVQTAVKTTSLKTPPPRHSRPAAASHTFSDTVPSKPTSAKRRAPMLLAAIGLAILLLSLGGSVLALKFLQDNRPLTTEPSADDLQTATLDDETTAPTATAPTTAPPPTDAPDDNVQKQALTADIKQVATKTEAAAAAQQTPGNADETIISQKNAVASAATTAAQPLQADDEQDTLNATAKPAPYPDSLTVKQSVAPANLSCLDLSLSRDPAYLWQLNFMEHFTSIQLLLENNDEKIASMEIFRRGVRLANNDKISIDGDDLGHKDIYSLNYDGRKVTIVKFVCACSQNPVCDSALLGFTTTKGKSYSTGAILGKSKILSARTERWATLLSVPANKKMANFQNPEIFSVNLNPALTEQIKLFRKRLPEQDRNFSLAYIFSFSDGFSFRAKSSKVNKSHLPGGGIFLPYHDAWKNLRTKDQELRNFQQELNASKQQPTGVAGNPAVQEGQEQREQQLQEKRNAREQASMEHHQAMWELVLTFSTSTLSLHAILSPNADHAILDDIKLQVRP